jgi:hypothetical protein
MLKKLIEKLFGKRCACNVKAACDHANNVSKKVKYCLDCKLIINNGKTWSIRKHSR